MLIAVGLYVLSLFAIMYFYGEYKYRNGFDDGVIEGVKEIFFSDFKKKP